MFSTLVVPVSLKTWWMPAVTFGAAKGGGTNALTSVKDVEEGAPAR
jgi:hypothetical protein